jgi:hypothetical protein
MFILYTWSIWFSLNEQTLFLSSAQFAATHGRCRFIALRVPPNSTNVGSWKPVTFQKRLNSLTSYPKPYVCTTSVGCNFRTFHIQSCPLRVWPVKSNVNNRRHIYIRIHQMCKKSSRVCPKFKYIFFEMPSLWLCSFTAGRKLPVQSNWRSPAQCHIIYVFFFWLNMTLFINIPYNTNCVIHVCRRLPKSSASE